MLERAANKQDLSDLTQVVSRLKQNVTDLEQKNYRADDMALGEFHSAREGSVTARSTNGSFYGDELAVASEGSARIRALAARVRGVTQGLSLTLFLSCSLNRPFPLFLSPLLLLHSVAPTPLFLSTLLLRLCVALSRGP